jgi:hypothetical protein
MKLRRARARLTSAHAVASHPPAGALVRRARGGHARTSTDPDLWGNVRFGLDILRSGSVPHLDPYSFTTDRTWVNHEWLAEVIIGRRVPARMGSPG